MYKEMWNHSYGNKIGKFAQGMSGQVDGTDTICFIRKCDISDDWYKDVTYIRIVCDLREEKNEPHWTQLMVNEDLINNFEEWYTNG